VAQAEREAVGALAEMVEQTLEALQLAVKAKVVEQTLEAR
jgi:hypothetical protein